MPDDLEQQIRENASGPKVAKGDSGSMEQHNLPDQIEADRYLASKKAAGGTGLGVKVSRMIPPGAG
jgi:hypothetical protein